MNSLNSKSSLRKLSLSFLIRALLILGAVCAVPSFGWAAGSEINPRLLRPGSPAVADLDGDKIRDVASGVRVGQTEKGYLYRIDLDLSSNAAPTSLLVYSSELTGLNVEALDVDGDSDLDLVVSGRLTSQPSGVWINDGKGHFSETD